MKRENIIKRIDNFFSYYKNENEPYKVYVDYCLDTFDEMKKDIDICDSRLICVAIEFTLRHFNLWR